MGIMDKRILMRGLPRFETGLTKQFGNGDGLLTKGKLLFNAFAGYNNVKTGE